MNRLIILLLVLSASLIGCVNRHYEVAPGGKVRVCHKNKNELYIPESAVAAHLRHGDRIGSCGHNGHSHRWDDDDWDDGKKGKHRVPGRPTFDGHDRGSQSGVMPDYKK